ncbi:unnamed protein product [Pleuronectes platessa]|uniref:Uncharacterized protein n=1 Tax=Pleuronectes platessa TaxID=8262 RepID=A0A9N7U9X2_PLEPL|nr:unnamed protein product [Pleuronectes platessa]
MTHYSTFPANLQRKRKERELQWYGEDGEQRTNAREPLEFHRLGKRRTRPLTQDTHCWAPLGPASFPHGLQLQTARGDWVHSTPGLVSSPMGTHQPPYCMHLSNPPSLLSLLLIRASSLEPSWPLLSSPMSPPHPRKASPSSSLSLSFQKRITPIPLAPVLSFLPFDGGSPFTTVTDLCLFGFHVLPPSRARSSTHLLSLVCQTAQCSDCLRVQQQKEECVVQTSSPLHGLGSLSFDAGANAA